MSVLDQVLSRLKGVRKASGGHMAFCPAHENTKTQSLSVGLGSDGRILFKCFGAECSFEEISKSLGFEPRELMGSNGNVVPIKPDPVTIPAFAKKIGLPESFLERHGWIETRSGGAVAIPYRDSNRAHKFSKLRLSLGAGAKYRVHPSGSTQIVYGLWLLREMRKRRPERLFLVEGESDTVTLWYHGQACLGIPGAAAVAKTLKPEYTKGFSEVVAVQENDPAGAKFVERIAECIGNVKVLKLPPEFKDTNDLFRDDPENFKREFLGLALKAEPYSETNDTQKIMWIGDAVAEDAPSYLWKPYVPASELTLLAGPPGVGKSLISLTMATCLTRGWKLPGADEVQIGRSLFMAEEDSAAEIQRRIKAASGDAKQIALVNRDAWPLDLSSDEHHEELRREIQRHKFKLAVVDPVQSWIDDPNFSLNDMIQVRRVMKRLAATARETQCAIVVVVHDKKAEVAQAIDAVLGSRDLVASARSVVMVAKHPSKSQRPNYTPGIMAHAKCNYSAAGDTIEYEIRGVNDVPVIQWGKALDMTAEDMVQQKQLGQDRGALEMAVESLASDLQGTDKVLVSDAMKEAKALGISNSTMRRAAKVSGLSYRRIFGKHYWFKTSSRQSEQDRDAGVASD